MPTGTESFDPLSLIREYYAGCSAGDVDRMVATLDPDVVHWFLAPNRGSSPVAGAEHLARYWRKVTTMIEPRWVVESICASGDQAVIEWTMWWRPEAGADRVPTRGAEWFVLRDERIVEIRSYYQMLPEPTELDGFPYADRGYSVAGSEHSLVHPDADRFGPSAERKLLD